MNNIPPLNDPPKKSLFERISEYRENNLKAYKEIFDYGNGILYFTVAGETFAKLLSNYMTEHKTFHIISIAADDRGGYGSTIGYFVIVEQKVEK